MVTKDKALQANMKSDLRANGGGSLANPKALAPKPLAARICGLSARGLALLSILALAGFGNNLYQGNQRLKAQVEGLSQELAQKEKLLAGQSELISKLESQQGPATAPVPQVINNIHVSGQAAAPVEVRSKRASAERYIATESLIAPKVAIKQLELSEYVDSAQRGTVRDFRDLLSRIQVQSNRFARHQAADREEFIKYRRITGADRLEWHRFTEAQSADRHELDRMFDKVKESWRNSRQVSFSRSR